MATLRISIVVPTMRREKALRETLASLLACDPASHEILVVDGDPSPSAQALVEGLAPHDGPPLRYVASDPGLTSQRNRGLAEASGDVVLFSDDDVRVSRDAIGRLARAYEEDSVVGVSGRVVEEGSERRGAIGSRLRRTMLGGGPEGTFTRFGYPRYLDRHADEPRDVEFMSGCFMSARLDVARRLGFDEHMAGYALGEDEDFSYRLSRVGRIRYLPEVVVEHRKLGFRTHDSRAFGRLVVRNRAYLFHKNFPQTPSARLQFGVLVLVLMGHRAVNREWRGLLGLAEGAAMTAVGRR